MKELGTMPDGSIVFDYKYEFRDGTEYSDRNCVVRGGSLKEIFELMRTGQTGIDIDNIARMSVWTDEESYGYDFDL